ncbi:MAG: FtsX-like permease family protein [Phycisphaerales bacterium]
MYQSLLVRKYLLSKIMPLLASVAVLLITATLLVVWSVMGGFLNMLVTSGRTMTGDIIISWPNVGFAHYEDLVKRLEADPMIQAASPMIDTYGLIGLPNDRKDMVLVRGVDPASYAKVTEYSNILWWKRLDKPLEKDKDKLDPRLAADNQPVLARTERAGLTLSTVSELTGNTQPAIVMGIEVSQLNYRMPEGYYAPQYIRKSDTSGNSTAFDTFLPNGGEVVLSVLPMDSSGRLVGEQASVKLPVANEFHSGIYELDSKVVIVPLPTLQKLLRMDAVKAAPKQQKSENDDDFASGIGDIKDSPARVTHVLVRGKGDYGKLGTADELLARVDAIYADFAKVHKGEVPKFGDMSIMTWEDQNRTMIAAVKKETGLVMFMFSIISLTSAFLVFAIFWSMIAEKTKDIGIMRALGASRWGVAGVWLFYGIAIGIVGAILGLGLGALIVYNINPIHEWIGNVFGLTIWDPKIYYFTKIPNDLTADKALIVCAGGVLCSIIGALIPSIRAAKMDPVRALRFE